MRITNASTRFATFGILGFFEFTVLSGKFELNLHGSKRVMQALCVLSPKFFARFINGNEAFVSAI
ncbi:hypothetical protein ERW57_19165 [Aliivibrio finisterrensis]|uniref:Uncharacterized protein n=1 Tax=Aliivibrio finisterrensis TaxID=511998 RepID=A0A4Q5KJY5_9GAMM|nr:hypothetical protein ERW57_19165 [Aliivibrio finisterrensis]RYU47090.1 hypothetical protein ERW56_19415 [Aliivibrio finisterrensis]RYU52842.1 hypothetical protein ERW50_18975 [Aliivibrio finisterrensis]RYU78669.1 hypothetical protein ERW55_18970 [Aliivibrio finisterrensis]